MKNFTNFLTNFAFLLCTTTLFAASHTVSNNPLIPAQFTDLQTAADLAADGDTLYISGSDTSYGDLYLGKKLTLIGEGIRTSDLFGFKTRLERIYLCIDAISGTNSDESSFLGLHIFNGINTFYTTTPSGASYTTYDNTKDVFISDCYIFGSIFFSNASDWLIIHSIIYDIYGSSANNVIITNCYLFGQMFFGNTSNTVNQCHINSSIDGNDYNISNCVIFSNVASSNINFTNNFYAPSSSSITDASALNNSNGSSSGNVYFAVQASVYLNFGSPYGTSDFNFNFFPDSPAFGMSTTGGDVGMLGGANPLPGGGISFGGAPSVPQFNSLNIVNPIVGDDCQIIINSSATVND